MARAKRKTGERPIGHAPYVKDTAKPRVCSTCDEPWPCKVWQRWTQRPEYQQAEREAAAVRDQLAAWKPGMWAQRVAYGPACTCGLRTERTCYRHPEKRET